MNYVFMSPAYPITCTNFCRQLGILGVNVLGIGDVPYEELNISLKESLSEYYYVDSLEDYDKVYRAVAFYIHKYGRIDWPSMGRYVYMAKFDSKEDMDCFFNFVLGVG